MQQRSEESQASLSLGGRIRASRSSVAASIFGKELYLSACVSCHDQPNSGGGEAVWETRAVSFPRKHFSHRAPPLDVVSGASPYARHEIVTTPDKMTEQEARGLDLYQVNCAFCHAPDGTGQNWIGSFLKPRPRDFTAEDFS